MSEIVITEVGPDRYEAMRDRRVPLLSAPTDLEHLKDEVQRRRLPADRVYLVEKDGYRVDITGEFSRRRTRSRASV